MDGLRLSVRVREKTQKLLSRGDKLKKLYQAKVTQPKRKQKINSGIGKKNKRTTELTDDKTGLQTHAGKNKEQQNTKKSWQQRQAQNSVKKQLTQEARLPKPTRCCWTGKGQKVRVQGRRLVRMCGTGCV